MTDQSGTTHGQTPHERYETASCELFSSGVCPSCSLLGVASGSRLRFKQAKVMEALGRSNHALPEPEPIFIPGTPWGSRMKAKMAVAGTVEAPIIGITRSDQSCVELVRCPLPPPPFRALLETMRGLIRSASLPPYSIRERRGELKGIIIMSNHDLSEGIVRFVLRSSEAIPRIRKALPELQRLHPWASVVSCNIQPLPAAILEGPDEVLLTEKRHITAQCGPVSLLFSPQSFMQVTPEVAGALYGRAAAWCSGENLGSMLDLFCGVGGFSLSLAPHAQSVTGIELSADAVESARMSAQRLGHPSLQFMSGDVDASLASLSQSPFRTIVANPPRRGLSPELVQWIEGRSPDRILYSSCNPETFARDIAAWKGRYNLKKLALFDMFPLTEHCEVLGLLVRT